MLKSKILIADDIDINLLILEDILKDDYDIIKAINGLEVLEILSQLKVLPKLILLDIIMPEMDGYEVLEILKSDVKFSKIPVIFITVSDAEKNALTAGAVDYISKPFYPEIVKLRVKNHIRLKNYSESLEKMVEKKVAEITVTRNNMIDAMANIIEYRNLESGEHVKRTKSFTKVLIDHIINTNHFSEYSRKLKILNPEVIVTSVALHDVGKIGIPDDILLKPGKLTEKEFDIIKTHTTIGKNIIESILKKDGDTLYLKHCRDIAYCHHERIDGKGYPNGLKGEDIPLSARILALVDVYDALTSKRVYKSEFFHEEAVEILKTGSGTQFDSILVEAFLEIESKFEEISKEIKEKN